MNMIARCPQCSTTFRVTPRQLKARSGKVRCGSCKAVFNGLENLLEDTAEPTAKPPSLAWPEHINAALTKRKPKESDAAQQELPIAQGEAATDAGPAESAAANERPAGDDVPDVNTAKETPHTQAPDDQMLVAPEIELQFPADSESGTGSQATDSAPAITLTDAGDSPASPTSANDPAPADSTPDTEDADAGKGEPGKTLTDPATVNDTDPDTAEAASTTNSAREVRDVPGYNRWAETPLSLGHMQIGAQDVPRSPAMRALLAVLVLVFAGALGLQAVYVWRVDIAARWPDARPILELACAEIGCSVPLPSEAEFVTIDASSLHIDPERPGTVVLEATLRNSAAYAQMLPLLELTLTDAHDRPLARRVLGPADYLSQAAEIPAGFAARSELPLRLWIDTDDLGAAGYRLYLFYAPTPLLASTSLAAQ